MLRFLYCLKCMKTTAKSCISNLRFGTLSKIKAFLSLFFFFLLRMTYIPFLKKKTTLVDFLELLDFVQLHSLCDTLRRDANASYLFSCSLITALRRDTTCTAESWRGTVSRPLRTKSISHGIDTTIYQIQLPNPLAPSFFFFFKNIISLMASCCHRSPL